MDHRLAEPDGPGAGEVEVGGRQEHTPLHQVSQVGRGQEGAAVHVDSDHLEAVFGVKEEVYDLPGVAAGRAGLVLLVVFLRAGVSLVVIEGDVQVLQVPERFGLGLERGGALNLEGEGRIYGVIL